MSTVRDSLERVEKVIRARPRAGQPFSTADFEQLLKTAVRMADASYGYLSAGEVELHEPRPALTSVPESPWPDVSLPLKACLNLAAQTAGEPIVFADFPPVYHDPRHGKRALGGEFVAGGGRDVVTLASPGNYLAAPLPGYGRYAGILLAGNGHTYGEDTCKAVARLVELAMAAGGPWPEPQELFGEETAGGIPVLDSGTKRYPVKGPMTIGQDPRYEIRVQDEVTSRQHAMVVPLLKGDVLLVDLKSSNGTFVNGKRIETAILAPGDVVHTARRNWQLVFRRVSTAPDASPLGAERNRVGFPLERDQGQRLTAAVKRWLPGSKGNGLAELCTMAVAQLSLSSLGLYWVQDGNLRFSGAVADPAPMPMAELDPDALKRTRALLASGKSESIDGLWSAVLLPGDRPAPKAVVVARRDPRTAPPPSASGSATIVGHASAVPTHVRSPEPVGPSILRALFLNALEHLAPIDEELLGKIVMSSSGAASGKMAAKMCHEAAQAGFPAEALALAKSMAQRFLDADELDALVKDLERRLA